MKITHDAVAVIAGEFRTSCRFLLLVIVARASYNSYKTPHNSSKLLLLYPGDTLPHFQRCYDVMTPFPTLPVGSGVTMSKHNIAFGMLL